MKLVLLAFVTLSISISPFVYADESQEIKVTDQELEKKMVKSVKEFILIDKDKRKDS